MDFVNLMTEAKISLIKKVKRKSQHKSYEKNTPLVIQSGEGASLDARRQFCEKGWQGI
jgi:hypothetical protein